MDEEATRRLSAAWLPAFFVALFSVIGIYIAILELSPAFEEHRGVRAALRKQLDSTEKLETEVRTKRRKERSLQEDPQAIQGELDRRGLLEAGHAREVPGMDQGPSSAGLDRGQSQR